MWLKPKNDFSKKLSLKIEISTGYDAFQNSLKVDANKTKSF